MEQVLDVYQRPCDPGHPVVCMDESSKQCVKETRPVLPMKPGQPERYDAEYERNGVAHLFMFCEPLSGQRQVRVTDNHGALEWAESVRSLVEEQYPAAEKITLVMDNLNTHTGASLYKAFPAEHAHRLLEKLEFCYTPKHGSWLNIAEIEFSALSRQCLNRRLGDTDSVRREASAWAERRNRQNSRIDWQFTTDDARIKLKHLYPVLSN
jgi:hypothetical protein